MRLDAAVRKQVLKDVKVVRQQVDAEEGDPVILDDAVNRVLAAVVARIGPETRFLEELGTPFDRKEGRLARRQAAGVTWPRAVFTSGMVGLDAGKLLIERLRQETTNLPLPEAVEHVVERTGLITHYQTEKEGQDRIENLRELVNAAAAFLSDQGVGQDVPANAGVAGNAAPSSQDPASAAGSDVIDVGPEDVLDGVIDGEAVLQTTPLASFLAHASLESGDNQALEGTDAMQLMTVHAAKGLEFDAVFITGLEEGLFPHENSVQEMAGLEEERRLMYVAITRARKRLYLSFSQTRMLHGQTRYNLRSRFFEELPDTHLKWLTPRQGVQRSHWGGDADAWSGGFGRQGGQGRQGGSGHGGRALTQGGYASQPAGPTPADARLASRFDRGLPWRIGQTVAHARFGEGVILAIEGSGSDARVQVNFGRQGIKWLALSVAKLDPVN
jgi:DNA helicase-2/ATP-dependent DNA helicase PcrA